MLQSVRGGWITLEVSPGRHTVPQGRGRDKRHVEAEHNNTEHKKHVVDNTATHNTEHSGHQGGITCGAIDEPRKSSKAIDERVIINFCDKNVAMARFRKKMS